MRRRLVSTGRDVRREGGLHTLYISPLKALAVDIARNLEIPVREMGLAVKLETRTGDTPASKRQRQRRYPPDILLTTPGAACAAAGDARCALSVRHAAPRRARRIAFAHHVEARRSFVARPGAAVPAFAAAHHRRAFRNRRRAGRSLPLSGAAAAGRASARRSGGGASRRAAQRHHARYRGASALGRPFGAACARRNLRADQDAQDDAGIRQHAQPGGIHLPGTVAGERRQSRHRAASRLARRRAAPQGGRRHGERQIARGGLHVFARSRRRLGRRRSRHQCRRAQGLIAADAARRPLQSSLRRAFGGRAGSRQPLRSAGMPRRHRCRRRQRAGHAAVAHRRARRAGAAHPRPRGRRAVPARRALR